MIALLFLPCTNAQVVRVCRWRLVCCFPGVERRERSPRSNSPSNDPGHRRAERGSIRQAVAAEASGIMAGPDRAGVSRLSVGCSGSDVLSPGGIMRGFLVARKIVLAFHSRVRPLSRSLRGRASPAIWNALVLVEATFSGGPEGFHGDRFAGPAAFADEVVADFLAGSCLARDVGRTGVVGQVEVGHGGE